MKSTGITKHIMAFAFAILILSCSDEKSKFITDFSATLDSADMIEFTKGDSTHRFVDPENLEILKKILKPVSVSETQSNISEFPVHVILYTNSEIVAQIGIKNGNNSSNIYAIGDHKMESAKNGGLDAFLADIQYQAIF